MLQSLAQSRAERLRRLSARLYRLAELDEMPRRGIGWVERLIDEGENIAAEVRREFR